MYTGHEAEPQGHDENIHIILGPGGDDSYCGWVSISDVRYSLNSNSVVLESGILSSLLSRDDFHHRHSLGME